MANSQQQKSLRIAVVGSGHIGSAVAFKLALAGHSVTCIARPDSTRLQQLTTHGLIVSADKAPVAHAPGITVASSLEPSIEYDLAIVAVTGPATEAVLPSLAASHARDILFISSCYDAAPVRAAVGPQRAHFGLAMVQAAPLSFPATTDADGAIRATFAGTNTPLDDARWVDLFARAGVPAYLEADMAGYYRAHVPLALAMLGACRLANKHGSGATWAEARTAARAARAGWSVCRRNGWPVFPGLKSFCAGAPLGVFTALLWAFTRVKMMREHLGTYTPEMLWLFDEVLNAAKDSGSPADVSATISKLRSQYV